MLRKKQLDRFVLPTLAPVRHTGKGQPSDRSAQGIYKRAWKSFCDRMPHAQVPTHLDILEFLKRYVKWFNTHDEAFTESIKLDFIIAGYSVERGVNEHLFLSDETDITQTILGSGVTQLHRDCRELGFDRIEDIPWSVVNQLKLKPGRKLNLFGVTRHIFTFLNHEI